MLVDMAGSENIEQAGQIGFEAKMQVSLYVIGLFYHPYPCFKQTLVPCKLRKSTSFQRTQFI